MNKKAIILWIITFLWMLVIFAFSANDGPSSNSKSKKITYDVINIVEKKESETEKRKKVEIVHPTVRKIAHAFEYAILCILLVLSLKSSGVKTSRVYLLAIIGCMLYAISDEIHQLFVNGRSAEFRDAVIDTGGSAIGLILLEIVNNIKRKNKSGGEHDRN